MRSIRILPDEFFFRRHRVFWGTARTASLVLLCFVSIAPADAPTSEPAGMATDAFRSFLLDIQQGNSADLAKLCIAHGDDAQTLLRDFQSLASAMGYLRTTIVAKWGADSVGSILPALPSLSDLDDVTETVNGDHAELSGDTVLPVHLVKVAGRWEIDLDWLAQSDDMPGNPHWFGQMAQAVRRTGDDIAGGRLTTPEAAALAMQAREAAIPDSAPTTQPATRP
jgi:hypothetical protein